MLRGARRAAVVALELGSAPSQKWQAQQITRSFTTTRPAFGMEEFFGQPLKDGQVQQKAGKLPSMERWEDEWRVNTPMCTNRGQRSGRIRALQFRNDDAQPWAFNLEKSCSTCYICAELPIVQVVLGLPLSCG